MQRITIGLVLAMAVALVGAVLGAPFISGSGAAGVSGGVLFGFGSLWPGLFGLAAGIWAVRLGSEAVPMFPLAAALMFLLGAATNLNALQLPFIYVFIFGAVLVFAGAVSMAYSKRMFISVCVASVPAFVLGARAMDAMPEAASVGYYLIGALAGIVLLLGCGVSLGLAMHGYAGYVRLNPRAHAA